ncbi:MAG: hypothetical protein IPP69_13660 [Flavobacteriales bacterium]|nr:hypothetical protein [Flavobacteriales bacterium]
MTKFSIRMVVALLCCATLQTQAQSGLSNEIIWKGSEFSAEFIGGLNSMNDGLHYTSTEESDAFGTRIVKYSYATGKEVGVIATAKDIFGDVKKKHRRIRIQSG